MGHKRKWYVDLVANVRPTHVTPKLLNGWKHFVIDKEIKLNDTYNFELIDKIKYLFKVRITRA